MSNLPGYVKIIVEVLSQLKDYKKGSSRAKIKKYIEEVMNINVNPHAFNDALLYGVANGLFRQQGNSFFLSKWFHHIEDKEETKETDLPA